MKGFSASAGQPNMINRRLVQRICPRWPKFADKWDTFRIKHYNYPNRELEQEDIRGYESYSNYQFALFDPGNYAWSSSYQRIMLSGSALLVPFNHPSMGSNLTQNIHMVMTTRFCDGCIITIPTWDDPDLNDSANCSLTEMGDGGNDYARCILQEPDPGSRGWCKVLHDVVAFTPEHEADMVASKLLAYVRNELSPMCYTEYMSHVLAGIRQDWSSSPEISQAASDEAMNQTFVEEFGFDLVDCAFLQALAQPERKVPTLVHKHYYDDKTCLLKLPYPGTGNQAQNHITKSPKVDVMEPVRPSVRPWLSFARPPNQVSKSQSAEKAQQRNHKLLKKFKKAEQKSMKRSRKAQGKFFKKMASVKASHHHAGLYRYSHNANLPR